MKKNNSTRRQFLKNAATVGAGIWAAPYFVGCNTLGRGAGSGYPYTITGPVLPKVPPPSDKIVMATIGTGGMGSGDMGRFMGMGDVQVVAVCDVDRNNRMRAKGNVDKHYGNKSCRDYEDFREMLDKEKDVDAVNVGTPDHWHALTTVAALKAGKDVYCQKPLANSIGESKAIRDAAVATGRIVQTGSQERSNPRGRHACELVLNGRIGKLLRLEVNLPCTDGHHREAMAYREVPQPEPVPEHLNWDLWLGHTPTQPYHPKKCHFWWRFILSFGGGEMTDRGAHVIDIGQMGAGKDNTGPVEIVAKGEQTPGSLYDAFWNYTFENTYEDGLKIIGTSNESHPRGVRFVGSDGWIMVKIHGCGLSASNPQILEEKIGPNEIQLGRSPNNNHYRNFIECIRERKHPMATAEIGHRTASLCHLNNIAMKLGRKLKWDPKKEVFIGDDAANDLVMPKMRAPWSL